MRKNYNALGVMALVLALAVSTPAQTLNGEYSAPIDLDRLAIHVMVLPSGKLLILNRKEGPGYDLPYWPALVAPSDPSDYRTIAVEAAYNDQTLRELFCAGHITNANGVAFLAGGHKAVLNEYFLNPVTLLREPGYDPNRSFKTGPEYPSVCDVDGVVVKSGGGPSGGAATDAAFQIDLKAANPAWSLAGGAGGMLLPRRNHVLVVLPTLEVVAFGGNLSGNTGDLDTNDPPSVFYRHPEIYDPFVPGDVWTALPVPPGGDPPDSQQIPRRYHMTAAPLPDGRVFIGGGDNFEGSGFSWPDFEKVQIYTPHYNSDPGWLTKRPTILTSPAKMKVGKTYRVTVDLKDPGLKLRHFALIGLPSVTHAYDMGGWARKLLSTLVSRDGNVAEYDVQMPADENKATPGHYMLFAVSDPVLFDPSKKGIPSVANIVQLEPYTPIFTQWVPLVFGASYPPQESGVGRLLADNVRFGPFGSGITPTGCGMWAEGEAPAMANPADFEATVESKVGETSANPGNFRIDAYQWNTATWHELAATTIERGGDDKEKRVRAQVRDDAALVGTFIRASDRRVRIRATWWDSENQSEMFDVSVDMIRMGVRQ